MPKTKEQNDLIKDERRKQILATALKSFCCIGFDATKIDDIAKQAGISHGLLYHYFTTKEEMFFELFFHSRGMYRKFETKILTDETLDPLQKIRKLLTGLLQKMDTDEDFCLLMYFILNANLIKRDFDKEILKLCETNHMFLPLKPSMKASLKEVLLEGQRNGSLSETDVAQMETVFWVIVHGIAVNKMLCIRHNHPFRMPDGDLFLKLFLKEN